jgi:hypothetical protein
MLNLMILFECIRDVFCNSHVDGRLIPVYLGLIIQAPINHLSTKLPHGGLTVRQHARSTFHMILSRYLRTSTHRTYLCRTLFSHRNYSMAPGTSLPRKYQLAVLLLTATPHSSHTHRPSTSCDLWTVWCRKGHSLQTSPTEAPRHICNFHLTHDTRPTTRGSARPGLLLCPHAGF